MIKRKTENENDKRREKITERKIYKKVNKIVFKKKKTKNKNIVRMH